MSLPSVDASTASEAAPIAMPAEEVGPIVVRAIRENRLHIFTHPNGLRLAEERFAAIRSDFAAEARAQAASTDTHAE